MRRWPPDRPISVCSLRHCTQTIASKFDFIFSLLGSSTKNGRVSSEPRNLDRNFGVGDSMNKSWLPVYKKNGDATMGSFDLRFIHFIRSSRRFPVYYHYCFPFCSVTDWPFETVKWACNKVECYLCNWFIAKFAFTSRGFIGCYLCSVLQR